MHRVALNLCYDRLRRRREKPDADAGLYVADPAPPASEAWLAQQRARKVHAALAQLPERQRAAIALVHFQELSNIAAAEMLEVSVEALESLLARGRRALCSPAQRAIASGSGGDAASTPASFSTSTGGTTARPWKNEPLIHPRARTAPRATKRCSR